jgi:hypothetical protein
MTNKDKYSISYAAMRLLNLIIAIFPTFHFYRATVQPNYEWNLMIMEGKGMSGDYWWLLLFYVLAWSTFCLDILYKRKWYFIFPVTLFSIILFFASHAFFITIPTSFSVCMYSGFSFHNLYFFLGAVIAFANALIWAVMDLSQYTDEFTQQVNLKNGWLWGTIIVLGILIILLFSFQNGSTNALTDRIAVGLTVIQILLIISLRRSSKSLGLLMVWA